MHSIHILFVCGATPKDNELAALLEQDGYGITITRDFENIEHYIERQDYDLVITSLPLAPNQETRLLETVKEHAPLTEVIIITATPSVEQAVACMKKEAFHYMGHPYKPNEVRLLAANALEKRLLRLEVQELRHMVRNKVALPNLIGKNPKMQTLKREIGRVAPLDCNVLILGETGTGKELVAKTIHNLSMRADQKFLAINCGAVNEELLGNEFFGHEKEAFTGAQRVKKGVFEAISGGTVLLDEIGDMPLAMQVQLLRVLQEKSIMRIGGTREIPIDTRVLAATNRPLHDDVQNGAFRQDLYYRLNVFTLRIPPLRERADDIPLFCRYFLEKYRLEFNKHIERFSDDVLDILQHYAFPGNVRELENIIERAIVLCDGPVLKRRHLPQRLRSPRALQYETKTRDHLLPLAELERQYIEDVVSVLGGNKKKAAEVLGIDRTTLWRKRKTPPEKKE
ncbi:MAG: sigma-54 dependent transcriptional regulator [Desulfohalobium sp.]